MKNVKYVIAVFIVKVSEDQKNFYFLFLNMKDEKDKTSTADIKKYMKKLGLLNDELKLNDKTIKMKTSKKVEKTKSAKIKSQTEESENMEKVNKTKRKKIRKIRIQCNEVSSTVSDIEPNILSNEMLQKTLLIKPGTKWFEFKFCSSAIKEKTDEIKEENLKILKTFAKNLLFKDVTLYRQGKSIKYDYNWIHTVLKNGTITDKVSAHTLLIQDSAIHNLSSIDSLIGMVNAKGKRECLMAIDTLKDLFLYDLLLEEKKLQKFEQHPLNQLDRIVNGNQETKKKLLILWYFEDQLKEKYCKFLKALEALTHDSVEKVQQKSVMIMGDLLINNPEQEEYLLEALVNKLGHPVRSVAAKVCHLLGQLVSHHPNIKNVVVIEVERLLYRHNISQRAQYYALCFLNQLLLNPEDCSLASRLIRIYFGFFKACTRTGEVENKMMSALLTGVNRAYPFVKDDKLMLIQQMDTLYQIVHLVNFNISIQALMLLFQVHGLDESLSDRFYVVLYKKLLDPGLGHSNRQTMFLNLIYRALKRDHIEQRVKAFVKRLFQVCEYQTPGLVCGTLILVSQLLKVHPNLLNSKNINIIDEDGEDDDDSYEHYNDISSENEVEQNESNIKTDTHKNEQSSWFHRNNLQLQRCTISKIYNPNHRNPLYAGAEYCVPWELTFLLKHFHPSVSVFSHQVLQGKSIEYDGDPLNDFTLIKFLDKFVYRNPKKPKDNLCGNERQKIFGHQYQIKQNTLNIKSVDLLENSIRPEEMFLYQYFHTHNLKHRNDKKDKDSDIESIASEDFENLLNKFEPGFKSNELDFAANVSDQKSSRVRKKRKNLDNEDIDDDDDGFDFNNDDDFNEAFEDFESDLENIETEDITEASHSRKSKRKILPTKKKNSNEQETFASAEQFSCLLEDNHSSLEGLNMNSLINIDRSHEKQLQWEISRDKWIQNSDWKSKKENTYQQKRKLKCKIKKYSNKRSKH